MPTVLDCSPEYCMTSWRLETKKESEVKLDPKTSQIASALCFRKRKEVEK